MNTDIIFSGHTTVPSDRQSPDGDLTLSLNLINEDGAIRAVQPPVPTIQILAGDKAIFLHTVASQSVNYIIAKPLQSGVYELYYLPKSTDSSSSEGATFFSTITDILAIQALGNTLIIATSGGLQYFLWSDSSYIPLGSRPPFISIDFGLENVGGFGSSKKLNIPGLCAPLNGASQTHRSPSNDDVAKFTQTVYGYLNSAIAENVTSKGLFYQPFFIRYAFRLYDGSYCWHSAPILMLPTVTPPIIKISDYPGTETSDPVEVTLALQSNSYKLNYRILADGIQNLQKWSDLISAIDIFISAPVYTYDPSANITTRSYNQRSMLIDLWDYDHTASFRGSGATALPESVFVGHYSDITTHNYVDHTLPLSDTTTIVGIRPKPDFHNKVRDTHLFYKVASIEFTEIIAMSAFKKLELSDTDLSALVSHEPMPDDYKSHATIIPSGLYAYNSRLNLFDISFRPAEPFPLRSCSQFSDPAGASSHDVTITVWTRINGVKCKTTHIGDATRLADIVYSPSTNLPRYIFYPDSSAYKMEITIASGPTFVVDLIRHDFLEGAYYYNPRFSVSSIPVSATPETDTCPTSVPSSSKLYTSEVNNPFVFPTAAINTIGSGRIIGVATAAKALSQGQFGQFPLYAFTDEGVWALEVSSTGTYSARQPITRDVCINAEGITQLDSAVLFPTERGIMLISGSQTQCISEPLNSDYPFDTLSLPGFAKLHDMLNHDTATDRCLPILPFTEFLKQCRMIYDYIHQRVIVYVPGVTYAYVLSLKSKMWGMTFSNIVSHLNSYPEALAVNADNRIVNFSLTDPGLGPVNCLFVTRPLKLGAPDTHKTIDSVILRGNFSKGHVKAVLYGSRDLINWHLVWSSRDHFLRGFRGTPYKYFRIAAFSTLSPDENIHSASVSFSPRLTNQPR